MKLAPLLLPALLIAGCTGKQTSTAIERKAPDPGAVASLTGPGGTVKIGDTIDQAKTAFPAPAGAQTFETSMSFTILAKDGWSWAIENPPEGFEAATKDGKIVGLIQTRGIAADEPDQTIAAIGEPTRKAEGKSGDAYVWDAGTNARFLLRMKSASAMLPALTLTLIGDKEDLKLLNYRHDDPGTFVKQMEMATQQMNSPEMKNAMETAARRAKERGKN